MTRTWVGPGTCPTKCYIKETALASASAFNEDEDGPAGSVSASDGLGDTPVAGAGTEVSSGSHLFQVDSSSGVISRSVTISASGGGSGMTCSAGASFSWDFDTRAVTISCPDVDTNPNGGSQYRDPALTGPVIVNVRQADGTLRGDTVNYKGSGGVIMDYTASAVGSWSAGSDYHWYSSLGGNSLSGVWPNINEFTIEEPYELTTPGPDHIFISLYDAAVDSSGNHAEATGNYYMHFHDMYEPASWPEDTGSPYKVMGTDPEVPGWPTYPWTAAKDQNGNIVPPIIGPQGGNAAINFNGSITQGGSVDGALGVDFDAVNLQFGGGYNWSHTTDSGISMNPTPAVDAGKQTWAVSRPSVNRHKGHLDIYGIHGYTGTGAWRKDDIVTTDYNYYQPYQSTSVTPFDPSPGWNPPGY